MRKNFGQNYFHNDRILIFLIQIIFIMLTKTLCLINIIFISVNIICVICRIRLAFFIMEDERDQKNFRVIMWNSVVNIDQHYFHNVDQNIVIDQHYFHFGQHYSRNLSYPVSFFHYGR